MKTNLKTNIKLIALALIISLIIFFPYIISEIPFTLGYDISRQSHQYYLEFKNLILEFFSNGTLPFYSWSMFLGNNFFASKTSYLMGDIYAYLALVIDYLTGLSYFDINMILIIIKTCISCLTMNYFLYQFGYKEKTRILGSLMYGFSGYAIYYFGQTFFLSFYSFMPLYFGSMYSYIKNSKINFSYILSCTLLIFTNYYFFFIVSFLSPFVFAYLYYIQNSNFNKFWISAFKLIVQYILGVSISAILIIPAFFYIVSSDRIGSNNIKLFFDPIIYLHQLVSSLIPNQLYLGIQENSYNIFNTGYYTTNELCLYAGSMTILLLPQFLTDKDKHFKKASIFLYIFFALFLLLPSFSTVMLLFSEASFRWVSIIILFNIFIGCRYLDNINKLNLSNLKHTLITIFSLLLIPTSIAIFINGNDNVWIMILIIILYFIIYILDYYLLVRCPKYLFIIILIEIIINSFVYSNLSHSQLEKENHTRQYFDDYMHVLQEKDNQLNDFLDYLDQENYGQYYRVFVPFDSVYWNLSYNAASFYQLNGLMTYDSTYAPSFNMMKELEPSINKGQGWYLSIEDPNLLNFLNTKYAIVPNEDQLPQNSHYTLIDDNYFGLKIYQNEEYRPVGTTYDSVITTNDYTNSQQFLDNVIAYPNDYNKIASMIGNDSTILESITYYGNHFEGYCESADQSFMVLSLPYDEGWKLLVNDDEVEYYCVNGGFIGFPIPQGTNHVSLYFVPKGFKIGAIISCLAALILLFLAVINKMHKSKLPCN